MPTIWNMSAGVEIDWNTYITENLITSNCRGIYIRGASQLDGIAQGFRISNNRINANAFQAIKLSFTQGLLIKNNTIRNNGFGFPLQYPN